MLGSPTDIPACRVMQHPLLLLVEDDAILALHTRARLEALGFGVETAASGEQAVARAAAEPPPDLVLMDIDLGPRINGTEAARRILAAREVPIVFLTMHSEPGWVDLVKGITRYGDVLKDSGEFVLAQTVGMAPDLCAAQRRARKSERRYRDLFDHSPDILVIYDHQARFADANLLASATTSLSLSQPSPVMTARRGCR